MSRIVDIEEVLRKNTDYEYFSGHPEYDAGVETGVLHMVDELENLPIKTDYTEIAQKLWIYICIIDDEKCTYEELADAIGLTDDELAYCRRLEH